MDKNSIKIASIIKTARLEKDLSLRDLADKCNISFSYLSALERAKHLPSREKIKSLSEVLNLDENILLNLAGYATELDLGKIPIDEQIEIPIIGTVKAGIDGLAFEDYLGFEKTDKNSVNGGGKYFYLKIKGDSMINEGILPGDLALVREQNDVEYGELAIILVDDEEGTIKRVYKSNGSITLQGANPKYPPRTFTGEEMKKVKIIGKVKELKRKF